MFYRDGCYRKSFSRYYSSSTEVNYLILGEDEVHLVFFSPVFHLSTLGMVSNPTTRRMRLQCKPPIFHNQEYLLIVSLYLLSYTSCAPVLCRLLDSAMSSARVLWPELVRQSTTP